MRTLAVRHPEVAAEGYEFRSRTGPTPPRSAVMSAPSVAIDPHHRYTPGLRDRVLGKLRASMQAVDESAYRMLTPGHLRALAELHSPQAPVLSLYLQLSPDRRATGSWRTHFKDLGGALIKSIAERRKREAVRDELA